MEIQIGIRMCIGIKIMVFVLMVVMGVRSQLVGRPVETVYNQYGGFEAFRVSWRSKADICANCLIQVTFPEIIHATAAPLLFDLSDQNGITYLQKAASVAPSTNIYYFCPNHQLSGDIWYKITIYLSMSPTIVFGLVGMNIVSGVTAVNRIYYESNNVLEYYHLETLSIPVSTTSITAITSANTQASALYPFQVSFTTNITSSLPTLITFIFTNQVYTSITAASPLLQNDNFNFIGTCDVICSSSSCVNPLSCNIQNNQVLLYLPSLSTTTLTIEFTILNPSFVDTTGIAAQITTNNGIIGGLAITNNLFTVNPITITAAGVNLHWGIPLNTVQTTMGLGLFVDGGWNTLDIGFTLSQVTMIGTQFKLQLYVGATSVLSHSINTNLPSLNGTSNMQCGYTSPNIQCGPIDAFTSTTLRYYLKFKAYFASTDSIASLGSITISLVNSNNQLFTPLAQALAVQTIPWANYRDTSGFHSNAYKIGETQVIGTTDTGLANSTSTFMNGLFTSNSSFIGIDPTIPNQQLVFLMQTLPAHISNGNPSQAYEMRVYLNPNIFSSYSTQGIDFSAYDATSNSYRSDAVSCYVNSSTSPTIQIYQCQAYKDHVYGSQVDNIFINSSYYGLYSFKCGNGMNTVCPGTSCAQSCRILKGKSTTSGSSGVFSIRNVNFISGYQSSYLADEKVLDFIVAFYHAGVLVSASLINAYTIKQVKLTYLSPSFYNVYLSSSKSNDGSRIPTLFSLQGHLSISEINGTNYDEFALFLPQEVGVNKYVEASGRIGCTHTCQSTTVLNTVTLCQDNWLCKQKISIKGIQNIDSSIDFKVPLEITSTIIGSFQFALIKSSTIKAIYRVYGSAIADPLSPAAIPAISISTYSNAWSSNSYWVKISTDTYTQALNLNGIVQFSSSNTVDMGTSSLTLSSSPSLTFTTLYTSVFSSFTTTSINNQLSCNSPFTYRFNLLFEVTVLWCPMVKGALNQVTINYPFYLDTLGAGFPFQNVFAYSVSDGNDMVAYRTQSNAKTAKDICVTSHLNNFNYADVAQQKITISLAVKPIVLDSSHYPSLQVVFTAPAQIPLNYVTCSATESLLNQAVNCAVVSSVGNIGILQLSSPTAITVTTIQLSLWVSPSAVSTASPLSTYHYSLSILLPQTDSSSNSAFYGSLYSPFSSTASSCSNYINLMNVAATNQVIFITPITHNAVSLNYYADLTFNLKFSTARSNILASSAIQLTFANAVTSIITSCSAWSPQSFIFIQEILSGNTVKLVPLAYDTPFTFTTYDVTCSDLIISQNSVTITAKWIDGTNILQQSVATPFALALPTSSGTSATLISKVFNTLGYDCQFSFSITVATNANDYVEIWLSVNSHYIHKMVLECYYLSNGLNQQVYCVKDWQGKIHIILTAAASASIDFSVYGIKQTSAVSTPYKLLASINQLQLYYGNAADAITPSTVSSQPIIISNIAMLSNYCLQLTLLFPVTFTGTFYIILDDSLMIAFPQILTCSIDGSVQTCTRVAPNLIAVASTVSLVVDVAYVFQICELKLSNGDVIDPSYLRFKVFTTSGTNIAIGSHEHIQPYSLSSLPAFPTTLLAWSQLNFNTSWTYHQIYIGYYSQPIYLSAYSQQIFTQNFDLLSTSTNSFPYNNITNNVLLGTVSSQIDIAYVGANLINAIDYLTVTHGSTLYTQPLILPLFVSDRKCIVSTEYTIYDTYPGGITLPILLDFSKCRPAADHFLTYTLNSAELMIDSGLTNQKVNASYPQVFIFVRQIPTNSLLNGQFTLTIQFSGPYSPSFLVASSIPIKINPGTILQIPQSIPPTIIFQNSSMINLTLQCNQPSTIYWALGFYPTILGITYEMIQTQLINSQQGIRSRVNDPYSWSHELYGLDYQYYSNKNKTLVIDTLLGGSNYIFKYFCINQLGFSSGGQLINFTTAATNYNLNKVELQYSFALTIDQANHIACSIAEVLLTPFYTVTTSTFSNCINASLTYFSTLNSTYYDLLNNNTYNYMFNVDSRTVTSSSVRNILPSFLGNHSHYINTTLPYSSISITPLLNNYDPVVKNHTFFPISNGITCTVDVGVARSYLILAYMQQTFDPMTMTLPPQHLIKLGNFSSVSKFNQVYMRYGSNNISINITSLQPYTNYSIFYFVTVDDPAINSKYTQVYYQNVQTSIYVVYDLFSSYLMTIPVLYLCFLML